ncbi:putative NRPS-like protein biosynthetic cluster, variant 2 [Marasmius oreades]|uniref:NRPS-like protein biosynthetic cluster, variant 2 n=1 Tax=Marasmius oreades TaxID=181124 RepID=A0A9P7USR5_9AGAR|nr:putative NRPS-like protein biosynthetic cluster, variant 2 [Marasmius oreades]KAG7093077.1 putative NRPS-like protein biosynthetic cluster, variant 2 [Marasmius oreades]
MSNHHFLHAIKRHTVSCNNYGLITDPHSCSCINPRKLEHSSHHRLFLFPHSDGSVRTITWSDAVDAIYRGVYIIQDRVKIYNSSEASTPVVAILAQSETMSYSLTKLSIMRSNFIPFLISPRNSPESVAHLLATAGVQHVLVSGDATCSTLVEAALAILKRETSDSPSSLPISITSSPMLVFDDLFPNTTEDHIESFQPDPILRKKLEDVVVYVHTSGSTSHPKIIPWTNRKLIEVGIAPHYGAVDMTNSVVSIHSLPMSHSFACFLFYIAVTTGYVLACFQPQVTPVVPTADNILTASEATDCDYVFTVPSVGEEWARRPERLKWLATKGGLVVGGGPLSKEAGDKLAAEAIPVIVLFGLTEIGPVSPFLSRPMTKDWEYFELGRHCKTRLISQNDGTYELILLPSPTCIPSVYNIKVDGMDGYTTSDLLAPHPTEKGYWRVFGRSDDLIVHANGEKTNPGPLEAILKKDPHIRSVILFGRGQLQVGVLVEPENPKSFKNLDEFRNTIWPTVEKMNAFAPQHSRLFKEMILIADAAKPFRYTAKGSVRRQLLLKDYEDEISKLYEDVETSTQPDIPAPSHWDTISCRNFVRKVVRSVLPNGVGDDDDLFLHGCDSLRATWIRNTTLRGIRNTTKLDTRQAAWNMVYEYPTIAELGRYLLHVVTHRSFSVHGEDMISPEESTIQTMQRLVENYSGRLPDSPCNAGKGTCKNKVVLLTGSTGAFGSFILASLIPDGDVSRVYALNRAKGSNFDPIGIRQQKAFRERGLDEKLLLSEKLELLEGNLLEDGFGLQLTVLQEMQQSVTHIIHNAWPVNFNLSLKSFEPAIMGLQSLLDLAIKHGSHFLFVSSVGVLSNASENGTMPETSTRPQTALGNGYAESKWVSEEIVLRASRERGLCAVIARVGQVCGSSENGAWSTQEWAPALIQGSAKLGCIPTDGRIVTWITPHVASRAIVDFLDVAATSGSGSIMHVRNPNPISWASLAKMIATELKLETVSYEEWLNRLESRWINGRGKNEEIRAICLLTFFRALLGTSDSETREAFGMPLMDIRNAVDASRTLADSEVEKLGEVDVKRWIGHWKKVGFV